jgi:hypothetical protein
LQHQKITPAQYNMRHEPNLILQWKVPKKLLTKNWGRLVPNFHCY